MWIYIWWRHFCHQAVLQSGRNKGPSFERDGEPEQGQADDGFGNTWNRERTPREEHHLHCPAPVMHTVLWTVSVRAVSQPQTTLDLNFCWPAGLLGETDGQGAGERCSSSSPAGSSKKRGSVLKCSPATRPHLTPKDLTNLQSNTPTNIELLQQQKS